MPGVILASTISDFLLTPEGLDLFAFVFKLLSAIFILSMIVVVILYLRSALFQGAWEYERKQKMSVDELENRLAELCNIALEENPKRYPGNPQFVRYKADKKWQEAVAESKEIVKLLKAKTGVDYKDASELSAKQYLARIQSGAIEITKPGTGNASVVKRAIIGGVIAGQAGAVVGAISAADQNNRNK